MKLSRPWQTVLAAVIVVLAQAAAIALAVFLSLQASENQLQASEVRQRSLDQVWCPALRDLTAQRIPKPPDPKADPSRANAYRFYTEFVAIRKGLGCDSPPVGRP